MSFPRYEKYKDSGVAWLGEVPEHWDVKRLKQVCEVFPSNVDKKTYADESPVFLCNYTDVYYNEQITFHINFMSATASVDQIAKFTLREGDTIITKDSETADDIAISAYVPQDLPNVVCGYHLSMIRPSESICGSFIKRLFDSIYVKSCCAVSANGLTRVGLGQYALDNIEMPFPPKEEQQIIATFLDREITKIDELIAEQQRLIELLKEKRQAVISHAVTKGLDPDVPMKDSGIEWLGEVPEHWEIKPLKIVVSMKSGEQITAEDIGEEGIYPVFGGNGLRGYTSNFTHEGYFPLIGRQGALCGNINYGKGKFWASEHAVVASPLLECSILWLGEILRTMKLGQYSITAAQPGLSVEAIGNLRIPFPPLSEQSAVATFLDRETTKIDELIAEAQCAIELLKERRTALISAAVTGKIDVRGLVSDERVVE